MKIYSFYHEPRGIALYFKSDPRKMSPLDLIKIWLKETDEYFESTYEKFIDDFINDEERLEQKYEELERKHPKKLQKMFFDWVEDTLTTKKLFDIECVYVDNVKLLG